MLHERNMVTILEFLGFFFPFTSELTYKSYCAGGCEHFGFLLYSPMRGNTSIYFVSSLLQEMI